MTKLSSDITITFRARDDIDADTDTTQENFHIVGDLRDEKFQMECRRAFEDLLQRAANTRREGLM